MRWTAVLPTIPGAYWYRADERTRRNFEALAAADEQRNIRQEIPMLVRTGRSVVINVRERAPAPAYLVCDFPQGMFTVATMAGQWGGPIPMPEPGPADDPSAMGGDG